MGKTREKNYAPPSSTDLDYVTDVMMWDFICNAGKDCPGFNQYCQENYGSVLGLHAALLARQVSMLDIDRAIQLLKNVHRR